MTFLREKIAEIIEHAIKDYNSGDRIDRMMRGREVVNVHTDRILKLFDGWKPPDPSNNSKVCICGKCGNNHWIKPPDPEPCEHDWDKACGYKLCKKCGITVSTDPEPYCKCGSFKVDDTDIRCAKCGGKLKNLLDEPIQPQMSREGLIEILEDRLPPYSYGGDLVGGRIGFIRSLADAILGKECPVCIDGKVAEYKAKGGVGICLHCNGTGKGG